MRALYIIIEKRLLCLISYTDYVEFRPHSIPFTVSCPLNIAFEVLADEPSLAGSVCHFPAHTSSPYALFTVLRFVTAWRQDSLDDAAVVCHRLICERNMCFDAVQISVDLADQGLLVQAVVASSHMRWMHLFSSCTDNTCNKSAQQHFPRRDFLCRMTSNT